MELIQLKRIIDKLIENGTDKHADLIDQDGKLLKHVFVSSDFSDDDVESTEIELRFS